MAHTLFAVLAFDILLVPAFVVIGMAFNMFWMRTAAANVKQPVAFILMTSFVMASAFGYWIIVDAQGGIV